MSHHLTFRNSFILLSENLFFIKHAGLPPTTVYGFTSFVTTDSAPMIAPSPMLTPGIIITSLPIQTSFPMTVSPFRSEERRVGKECTSWFGLRSLKKKVNRYNITQNMIKLLQSNKP